MGGKQNKGLNEESAGNSDTHRIPQDNANKKRREAGGISMRGEKVSYVNLCGTFARSLATALVKSIKRHATRRDTAQHDPTRFDMTPHDIYYSHATRHEMTREVT